MSNLLSEVADFRRIGSAALDLCYVAAGRVDGYFRIWCESLGRCCRWFNRTWSGRIGFRDYHAGHNYLTEGHIVAAPARIVKEILAKIQPCIDGKL